MYNRLQDIKKFKINNYRIEVPWIRVPDTLERYIREYQLELQPEFQRGIVWAKSQQSAFVEYVFQGGKMGLDIYFNHPGWQTTFKGTMVCVDGLQRLTSALLFINGDLKLFGRYLKEYEDGLGLSEPYFYFNVLKLANYADILKWYLFFNRGGTLHTDQEIAKVENLLNNIQ